MILLLISFLLGIGTVILIQYFTLSWLFIFSPKYKPQRPPPYCPPSLPPDLSHRSSGPFREETSQWVNFCGAFLFQELRESNLVKKAVITKLNEEFKELKVMSQQLRLLSKAFNAYYSGCYTSIEPILDAMEQNMDDMKHARDQSQMSLALWLDTVNRRTSTYIPEDSNSV